jgi:hypothetical protein
MTAALIFDQSYRGDVWRLEVTDYDGRTFGNWRKWWRDGDTLKPSREGVTIPLERFPELHAANWGLPCREHAQRAGKPGLQVRAP